MRNFCPFLPWSMLGSERSLPPTPHPLNPSHLQNPVPSFSQGRHRALPSKLVPTKQLLFNILLPGPIPKTPWKSRAQTQTPQGSAAGSVYGDRSLRKPNIWNLQEHLVCNIPECHPKFHPCGATVHFPVVLSPNCSQYPLSPQHPQASRQQ